MFIFDYMIKYIQICYVFIYQSPTNQNFKKRHKKTVKDERFRENKKKPSHFFPQISNLEKLGPSQIPEQLTTQPQGSQVGYSQ